MRKYEAFLSAILCLIFTACQTSSEKVLKADEIIEKAIEYSGSYKINQADISFDFRDIHYQASRDSGAFMMERKFENDSQKIHDRYTNKAFERLVDGNKIALADSLSSKYRQSVNSVFYFALLPYKLNDAAVIAKKVAVDSIDGKPYHKVKISFEKEGGGEDHQDVFFYWFSSEDFSLDYLAYSFHTNGGGMRFRKAFNERFIKGIRFVDYENYKPKNKDLAFNKILHSYTAGNMDLLSMVKLKNIQVELNK